MIKNKEDILRMHPNDTVIILTTEKSDKGNLSLSESVHFLTLTFPGSSEQFALALSGREEADQFQASNMDVSKLHRQNVQLKELFPVLMTSRLNLIMDPFGEELTTLTPMEMGDYCQKHQKDIFKGDLREMSYMNFRAAQAKARGGKIREDFLQDVMQTNRFWVASFSFAPISPFVTRIGKLDARPHIMVFSDHNMAMKFCQHINPSLEKKTVPIQVNTELLLKMVEDNWSAGVHMFYMNDGAEGIAFSYHDMKKALAG